METTGAGGVDATGASGIRGGAAGAGWGTGGLGAKPPSWTGALAGTAGGRMVTDRGRGIIEGTDGSVGALSTSNVLECCAAPLVADGSITAGGCV
jgi:hypothetical protein